MTRGVWSVVYATGVVSLVLGLSVALFHGVAALAGETVASAAVLILVGIAFMTVANAVHQRRADSDDDLTEWDG